MKPQFLHILAWQKYWLMAVNSTVSAPLSASMTCGSPFIGHLGKQNHGTDRRHGKKKKQDRAGSPHLRGRGGPRSGFFFFPFLPCGPWFFPYCDASRAASSMASCVFLETRPPALISCKTCLANIVFLAPALPISSPFFMICSAIFCTSCVWPPLIAFCSRSF